MQSITETELAFFPITQNRKCKYSLKFNKLGRSVQQRHYGMWIPSGKRNITPTYCHWYVFFHVVILGSIYFIATDFAFHFSLILIVNCKLL